MAFQYVYTLNLLGRDRAEFKIRQSKLWNLVPGEEISVYNKTKRKIYTEKIVWDKDFSEIGDTQEFNSENVTFITSEPISSDDELELLPPPRFFGCFADDELKRELDDKKNGWKVFVDGSIKKSDYMDIQTKTKDIYYIAPSLFSYGDDACVILYSETGEEGIQKLLQQEQNDKIKQMLSVMLQNDNNMLTWISAVNANFISNETNDILNNEFSRETLFDKWNSLKNPPYLIDAIPKKESRVQIEEPRFGQSYRTEFMLKNMEAKLDEFMDTLFPKDVTFPLFLEGTQEGNAAEDTLKEKLKTKLGGNFSGFIDAALGASQGKNISELIK